MGDVDEPVVVVRGLDHVVFQVADADRSLAWYREVLGLAAEREAEWRAGEAPFVSIRVDAHTVVDLQVGERTGENVNHVALVVDPDVDLDALAVSGAFDVVSGPKRLWGAQGWGRGMYVRDPDGNVIELRVYPTGAEADA